MKTKLITLTLISAGICSLNAADLSRDHSTPQIDQDTLGVTIMAPINDALVVMNVRVYGPNNELIMQHRSLGESVDIPTADLADGEYRYESVAVIATGDDEEGETAKRNFGSFTVKAGEIQAEKTPLGDELGQTLQQAAGSILSWLIPSAHADIFNTVEIESNIPILTYDDTDSGQGSDWQVPGYSNLYGIWDSTSGAYAVRIQRTGNNTESFMVNSAGDIFLANDAVSIDRSATAIGIGTLVPSADLDIHDAVPSIQLHDETDGTTGSVKYNAGLLALEGNSDQNILALNGTAPGNSIRVDGSGSIGLGTASPNNHLHVFGTGNFASIGFGDASNTRYWNINSGTSGLWFSNSATGGGSTAAAFKLSRSALDNALVVDNNSNVGIGTEFPGAALEIRRGDGTAKFIVNETTGTAGPRTLFELRNPGNTKFSLTNTDAAVEWAFANPGSGFRVSRQGSGVVEFDLLNNGNLTIAGTLTENSDRNAKTNIVDIDQQDILDKITRLPIQQWQYKDALGENHIGPMAQDFYAAFGLGATNKGIATLDSSGVALAAIQALAQENQELKTSYQHLLLAHQQERSENRQQRTQLLEQRQAILELQELKHQFAQQQQTITELKVLLQKNLRQANQTQQLATY